MKHEIKYQNIGIAIVSILKEYHKSSFFWLILILSVSLSVYTRSPQPFCLFLFLLAVWPIVLIVSIFGIRVLWKVTGRPITKYLIGNGIRQEDPQEGQDPSRRYGNWPYQW